LGPNKDLLPACHGLCGGGEIPFSLETLKRTGLYTTYEYPDLVPTITIGWEELTDL
jgi:hypothetical protein